MALIKLGDGITGIKGKFAGNIFSRDKSGIHIVKIQRKVHQRTDGQAIQRRAFQQARAFSTDNREVAYNIYRALNGLPATTPPIDFMPGYRK